MFYRVLRAGLRVVNHSHRLVLRGHRALHARHVRAVAFYRRDVLDLIALADDVIIGFGRRCFRAVFVLIPHSKPVGLAVGVPLGAEGQIARGHRFRYLRVPAAEGVGVTRVACAGRVRGLGD